jgi:hypothetical protein
MAVGAGQGAAHNSTGSEMPAGMRGRDSQPHLHQQCSEQDPSRVCVRESDAVLLIPVHQVHVDVALHDAVQKVTLGIDSFL